MARLTDDRGRIYGAAEFWKHECLLGDGSVFSVNRLWIPEVIAELTKHFVQNLDESPRSFEEKLHDQLEPASASAKKLAAEMLWVMMLFPSNIRGKTKVNLVRRVWSWSGESLPNHEGSLGVLEMGIGSGGTGYNNFRPFEFALLIRFAAAWKELGADDRQRLLADGWLFADWFDRLPDATSRQLRHMLLHLLFPDLFERISSTGDKKKVDRAFFAKLAATSLDSADRGPSPLARDRRLWHIRQALEAERPGQWIDFYETRDLAARWRSDDGTPPVPTPTPGKVSEPVAPPITSPRAKRFWAIGAGAGASRWPAFVEDKVIAIGWDDLGDLRQYKTVEEVRAAIGQVYGRDQIPINDGLACHQFCHEMREGDEVYVKQGLNRVVGVGRIVGPYEHDASRPDFKNIHKVEWLRRGHWTLPDVAQLPMKTLTDVSNYGPFRQFMREQEGAGEPIDDAPVPYSIEDLAKEAFLPREQIESILDGLRRRKNIILQGAPGVGKSFLARRLGYALLGAKSPENVQTVQFHQSYAYEDFIQGWRPNGKGGFDLRSGVFYSFCLRAQANPSEPHVFVIDEINRGNLSKVFGELLLLVETDKRGPDFAIPLTYAESSEDTFYVPDNVYIIGLMNTADRSLAMVDYALRRRFAFKTLQPAFEAPLFRATLMQNGVDGDTVDRIVSRVGAVNARIRADRKNLGPGFEIGHSYFCPAFQVPEVDTWYGAVIEQEIKPLLEEYWFDDEAVVAECLATLEG